jgi:hypothetical protein
MKLFLSENVVSQSGNCAESAYEHHDAAWFRNLYVSAGKSWDGDNNYRRAGKCEGLHNFSHGRVSLIELKPGGAATGGHYHCWFGRVNRYFFFLLGADCAAVFADASANTVNCGHPLIFLSPDKNLQVRAG